MQASDESFLDKIHQQHGQDPYYVKPKVKNGLFGINHYAGCVMYTVRSSSAKSSSSLFFNGFWKMNYPLRAQFSRLLIISHGMGRYIMGRSISLCNARGRHVTTPTFWAQSHFKNPFCHGHIVLSTQSMWWFSSPGVCRQPQETQSPFRHFISNFTDHDPTSVWRGMEKKILNGSSNIHVAAVFRILIPRHSM